MQTKRTKNTAEKTRLRIVRAAEKLFAERGYRAMTLRDVTREARVNLAAVNYHFGSKTNLIRAVVADRFIPINDKRMRRLEAHVASYGETPVPLDQIFAALFEPIFDQINTSRGPSRTLSRMIGRALTEPADFIRTMHKEFFLELSRRFMAEIQRTCPELNAMQVQCRFYLSISTMLGTITEQARFENLTGGEMRSEDSTKICNELVAFVVSGFRQS